MFRWFRSGVSMVSAVPVVSFRWLRFGVSGFSTCHVVPSLQMKAVTFRKETLNILSKPPYNLNYTSKW